MVKVLKLLKKKKEVPDAGVVGEEVHDSPSVEMRALRNEARMGRLQQKLEELELQGHGSGSRAILLKSELTRRKLQ